jgi:hypothetical protein
LFAGLLLLYSIQLIRYRLWSFSVISVACAMEIIGFVLRILSSQIDPYRIAFFVGQYFCITCAPVFISAGIYIYLTKFTRWAIDSGFPSRAMVRFGLTPSRLLWIFISADLICTALQVTGASLIGNRASKQRDTSKVNRILIAGLAAQVASFILFLTIMATFIVTCSRYARENEDLRAKWMSKRLASLSIFVAALLVFLRTVFRLVESAEGVFGYLSSHEVFFGCLEFVPIVLSLFILSGWHPGRVFKFRSEETQKHDVILVERV